MIITNLALSSRPYSYGRAAENGSQRDAILICQAEEHFLPTTHNLHCTAINSRGGNGRDLELRSAPIMIGFSLPRSFRSRCMRHGSSKALSSTRRQHKSDFIAFVSMKTANPAPIISKICRQCYSSNIDFTEQGISASVLSRMVPHIRNITQCWAVLTQSFRVNSFLPNTGKIIDYYTGIYSFIDNESILLKIVYLTIRCAWESTQH